jgi:hypothetical protein
MNTPPSNLPVLEPGYRDHIDDLQFDNYKTVDEVSEQYVDHIGNYERAKRTTQ